MILFYIAIIVTIAIAIWWLREHLQQRAYKANLTAIRENLNQYCTHYKLDIVYHTDHKLAITYIDNKSNKQMYLGIRRNGFLYNTEATVGASPSLAGLDDEFLNLLDADRAIRLLIGQNAIKVRK